MTSRIFSALVLAAVLAVLGLLVIGCDSMTDYPHNGEQTDRSDTLKTGSGTYAGTDSAYEAGNPAGNGATTAGITGSPGMDTGGANSAGHTGNMGNRSGTGMTAPGTGTYGGGNVGGSNAGNTGTTVPNTERR
ncbi:MAG TPA: hypothetical protein VLI90_11855 [Tepidisphaeraceae bacterium]|nr:hypothetical protein [Tepidisphaeraceae bacterium]